MGHRGVLPALVPRWGFVRRADDSRCARTSVWYRVRPTLPHSATMAAWTAATWRTWSAPHRPQWVFSAGMRGNGTTVRGCVSPSALARAYV